MRETKSDQGLSKSDIELFNVFELASKKEKKVLLLRIGGPLGFRRLVVSSLDATGFQENKATNALLDQRIPSISVLIADPDGVPFLTRLDYEGSGTWGIWRVRDEILSFAESLCKLINKRQKPEDKIGFHRGELFWNLGIVEQTSVLVRPYCGNRTGHDDNDDTTKLEIGNVNSYTERMLACSFINYWKTIARRADTKWINYNLINNNNSEPEWPSLYKGNAVLSGENDLDQEDSKDIVPEEYVSKICRHKYHQKAELAWVAYKGRKSSINFRPVEAVCLNGKVPRTVGQTQPVVIEKLKGFSLFEIANQISITGQSKKTRKGACRILGEILLDSIESLKDFRDKANSVIPEDKRVPYQYETQLKDALREVRSFIGLISSYDFDEAIIEVGELGKALESKIKENCPFRDAQLKNRIWITEEKNLETLVNRLLKIPYSKLHSEIKTKVKDIDFETSGFNVTEWDDVIHILFFEKSGILSFKESETEKLTPSIDPIDSYKYWWGKVGDEKGLWMTVLARSIREFCRRLWYAKTMPNTYKRRYKYERRDYFLDLALYALQQLSALQQPSEYENIRNLLAEIKKSPEVWLSAEKD